MSVYIHVLLCVQVHVCAQCGGGIEKNVRCPFSLGDVPVSLPVAAMKHSDKSNVKEKEFVLANSSHNGKVKVAEVAGHSSPTIGNQRGVSTCCCSVPGF